MESVVMSYLSHLQAHTHSDLSRVGGLSSQSLPELKSSGGLYLTLLENLGLFITLSNVSLYYQITSSAPLMP